MRLGSGWKMLRDVEGAPVKIANSFQWIPDSELGSGWLLWRCLALLAVVSEVVSVLSTVPDFSLSDFSHGVCESDGVIDWAFNRSVCD